MSGLMFFHQLIPTIGLKETRSVTVFERGSLPDRSFGFVELYCIDPECDCRRVLINVISNKEASHVATISHSFEPPSSDDIETEQTFLDPLNPQSRWSTTLLGLFKDILRDENYRSRLERHYRTVKAALVDPKHPIHKVIGNASGGTFGRQAIDPYAPCPCGSGKKYKWCCRGKE